MTQRNISPSDVEAVLREYDTEYLGRHGTRVLIGEVHDRRIKVVVGVARSGAPLIVTVAGKEESI
jgi:hypothetical protein